MSENRQQQFKRELFDLLRRYQVIMTVEEDNWGATGVNFYSPTQWDDNNNVSGDMIDLTVGKWEDGS